MGLAEPQGLHSVVTSVPQLQRRFLTLYAEWRRHERRGDPPKIWVMGIMTHPDQNAKYHAEMTAMFEFWSAFSERETPRGNRIAKFATDREIRDAYVAWETEHPGTSSFSFEWEAHLSGDAQPFPYDIEGLVLGLKDSELVGELDTWHSQSVTAYELVNREILRGPANPSGQQTLTVGDTRLPVYLLWSDAGEDVTINFSGQELGTVFVKDARTGDVATADASMLTVTEAPIAVSATDEYF